MKTAEQQKVNLPQKQKNFWGGWTNTVNIFCPLKFSIPLAEAARFLNQALEFLINEHEMLDGYRNEILQESFIIPDVSKSILENNLYGVDINEEAVEIAKLSLWLRTAEKGRKLSDLNSNIKCGNSLIDDPEVAGEKAFNWKKEFPEIMKAGGPVRRSSENEGGFDVVIGNPPYVNAIELKKSLSEKEYTWLKNNYITAKGTVDLYIYFFERAFNF